MIYQNFQKIKPQDILDKKFYPVWFFTNEKIASFLQETLGKKDLKNIFAIGGGGDVAFNILSFKKEVKRLDVCDYRQLATITIDIKKSLFKSLSLEEWGSLDKKDKEEVFKKIESELAIESKYVLRPLIKESKEKNFWGVLRISKHWYKDSLKKPGEGYLLYQSEKGFLQVKENIKKINIYYGDFFKTIEMKKENFYDLVYTSNIFDNKKYCTDKEKYLSEARKKLNEKGLLILATQYNSQKIIKTAENCGFKSIVIKKTRFNPIMAFLNHYAYSFVAFKKKEQ